MLNQIQCYTINTKSFLRKARKITHSSRSDPHISITNKRPTETVQSSVLIHTTAKMDAKLHTSGGSSVTPLGTHTNPQRQMRTDHIINQNSIQNSDTFMSHHSPLALSDTSIRPSTSINNLDTYLHNLTGLPSVTIATPSTSQMTINTSLSDLPYKQNNDITAATMVHSHSKSTLNPQDAIILDIMETSGAKQSTSLSLPPTVFYTSSDMNNPVITPSVHILETNCISPVSILDTSNTSSTALLDDSLYTICNTPSGHILHTPNQGSDFHSKSDVTLSN